MQRTTKVFMHRALACARGSRAATKSHTLIFPSYAPLTIRFESKRMQRTSSSCPSSIRKQAPHSMSHNLQERKFFKFFFLLFGQINFPSHLIVLSELPLTTNLSRYCKQAIPRL